VNFDEKSYELFRCNVNSANMIQELIQVIN